MREMGLDGLGVDRHLGALSIAFRVVGALAGLPAVVVAGFAAESAVTLFEAPPGDSPVASDDGAGLISFVVDAAAAADPHLHLATGAAAWLLALVAIVAAFTACFSGCLYVVGSAIARRSALGRALGVTISAVTTVASVAGFAFVATRPALDLTLAALALALAGASSYALWVLERRFD